MKKLLAVLASFALVATLGVPAKAVGDAYNAEAEPLAQTSGRFLVAEEGNFMPMSTFVASESNTDMTEQWICDGALDPACARSKTEDVMGNFLLPICKDSSDDYCIVALEITIPGKDPEQATYLRNVTGQTFPAEPSVNYPGGSTASLWEAKNSPSASGTTTYAVMAKGTVSRHKSSKFTMTGFSATVVPYREQKGNWEDPYQMNGKGEDIRGNRARFVGVGGYDQSCAWNEKGACGVPQDYADGAVVKLTVRIASTIGGWFKGRMKDPKITVEKFSKTNNQITVESQPATVARMSYTVEDTKNLTAKEISLVKNNGGSGGPDHFTVWSPAWDDRTFSYVEYFRPKVKDTASGMTTFWNFSTSDINGGGQNQCLSDRSKVLGLVTTNAMVFDGGIPKFTGGFLSYKVAGLHYAPNGTDLNLGVYDLVMRSDTARCLYGFSKAPLSATVSVVNEKGTKTTATTVVSEKNGWLKMAAYGFTFSKKTIKVKITKKKK